MNPWQHSILTRSATLGRRPVPPPPEVPSDVETTFDNNGIYAPGFVLPQPTANRTYVNQSAPAKVSNLTTAGNIDNQTGAMVVRLTDRLTEGNSTTRNRHEYARRAPWCRDNGRYITQSANGFWQLYNASTHARISAGGTGGAIPGMAGDCEPLWSPHAGEERILFHTDVNGGLVWTKRNVDTGATSEFVDFGDVIPVEIAAGRLPSSFSDVAHTWFKGEGRPSNDYRYWCLKCDTAGFTQRGVMMWDSLLGQVTGYVATSQAPDHVSTSPLGTHMLLSYYDDKGVRAFSRTYQGSNVLDGTKITGDWVQHGDTALGPLGEQYYVQADFGSGSTTEGKISISDITTGVRIFNSLGVVYPVGGESVSIHVSGICSEKRPGWVCVSTYASYQNSDPNDSPATAARIVYETVYMLELKTGGKRHLVGETHEQTFATSEIEDDPAGGLYFLEPHAATNYDGTRIAFCSGFGGRSGVNSVYPDSFAFYLPSTAY